MKKLKTPLRDLADLRRWTCPRCKHGTWAPKDITQYICGECGRTVTINAKAKLP
jgi:DNA-directed RNA polymerase subunit RPC12/RpoP